MSDQALQQAATAGSILGVLRRAVDRGLTLTVELHVARDVVDREPADVDAEADDGIASPQKRPAVGGSGWQEPPTAGPRSLKRPLADFSFFVRSVAAHSSPHEDDLSFATLQRASNQP